MPGDEGSFMTDPVFEATFGRQESDKMMESLKSNLLSEAVLDALRKLIRFNNFTLAIMLQNFPVDRGNRIAITAHFDEVLKHSISV